MLSETNFAKFPAFATWLCHLADQRQSRKIEHDPHEEYRKHANAASHWGFVAGVMIGTAIMTMATQAIVLGVGAAIRNTSKEPINLFRRRDWQWRNPGRACDKHTMPDDRVESASLGAEGVAVAAELTAVIVAVTDGQPRVLTIEQARHCRPDLRARHRSLQAGLRSWVETQTHHPLGYVEQLYTFADQDRSKARWSRRVGQLPGPDAGSTRGQGMGCGVAALVSLLPMGGLSRARRPPGGIHPGARIV